MDLGSLLGAGSTLVGGAAEGMQARKDREAKARQQMIENSLKAAAEQNLATYRQSQIGKNLAETTKLQQPVMPRTPQNPPLTFEQRMTLKRTAPPRAAGTRASGAANSVTSQEVRFAARNALAALDQADGTLRQDPNADIYPTSSATLEQAGHVPIIGTAASGFLHSQAQSQMTPAQQRFQQSMDQFLHNYGALLPRGGRSVQILQNLRNSFAPRAGQTDAQVRRQFTQARASLRRQLQSLAAGQAASVEGLPMGEDVQEPMAEMPAAEAPVQPSGGSPTATSPRINWGKWRP